MKHRSRIYLMLFLVGTAAAVLTLGSRAAAPDDTADLFKAKCSMCHGPDGKGFSAIKTPDFTDPKWQAKLTDPQIEGTIKNGKKDTMMKGFGDKLKETEIDSLTKYIRSLNTKK